MRLPQTPERIKEAPAQVLRAVFAGVGQVLLMTERIRRRAIGQEHSQAATGALDTRDAPAPARGNGAQTATPRTDQADQVKAAGTTGTNATATGAKATSSAPTSAAKPSTAKASTAKADTAKASTTKTSAAKANTPKTGTAKAEPAKTKATSAKAGKAKAATAKPSNAETDAAPAETATPAQPGTVPPEVGASRVLPVPHYSELSIASLRARLRGLDIAQVRDLLSYERSHEDRANVIAMFERRIAKLEEAEGADPAAS